MARYYLQNVPTVAGQAAAIPTASAYVLRNGTVEERNFASVEEAARCGADAFKKWNKRQVRKKRHFTNQRLALLTWIHAESAVREYAPLFIRVAETLASEGFSTLAVPLKNEFEAQLKAFYHDHPDD